MGKEPTQEGSQRRKPQPEKGDDTGEKDLIPNEMIQP